ncbi:MAG: lipid II flippase MurJ, partial [Anaerolineae bacterium]
LEVTSRLFYAQKDMWTPLWAALVGLVANASLGWLLLPSLAQGSIALSNSLGVGLQVSLLLFVAWRRLEGIEGRALLVSAARTLVASSLMAAIVLGLRTLLTGLGSRMFGVVGLGVGGATYVLMAALLGSAEIRQLPRLLLGRQEEFGAPASHSVDAGPGRE